MLESEIHNIKIFSGTNEVRYYSHYNAATPPMEQPDNIIISAF